MMIAPAIMVLMGASQVAVPEAVGALTRGFDTLRRLCLLLSGALAALALVWGLVVLAAFPHGPGRLVLGPVWDGAVVLLPGIIVSATVGCLSVGPVAGLRALERADLTMRAQMVVTPPAILACGGAGMLWGAQGAVWGAAAGAVFATLVWWHSFAVAKRDRATVAAPEDPLHKPRALADPPSTAATRLEPPGGVAGHGGRRRVAEG
jgi:O-antigen/teichoic acid export membrane protein